jgi:hypothetical protein
MVTKAAQQAAEAKVGGEIESKGSVHDVVALNN